MGDATFQKAACPPRSVQAGAETPGLNMLHKAYPVNRLARHLAPAGLAIVLLGSGCLHKQTDELTQAVMSGERPVAMAGSEAFFGGKVTARVTVSRGIGRGAKGRKVTLLSDNSGFEATSGLIDEDRDNERIATEAYADYARAKVYIGSPPPPVTRPLIVINPGAEPVTVTMIDFESDLGNFAIEPDTLTVPPGQNAEPTAMVSQLGVSADEIPVKVTLKIGKAKETRSVLVRSLLDESGKPKTAAH
jgi:hypothetical protein